MRLYFFVVLRTLREYMQKDIALSIFQEFLLSITLKDLLTRTTRLLWHPFRAKGAIYQRAIQKNPFAVIYHTGICESERLIADFLCAVDIP